MDSSLARARQQLFLSEVANSAAGKTHERVRKSPPAHMLYESLGTTISFAFSEDINSSLNLESLVFLLKWGENVSGFLCSRSLEKTRARFQTFRFTRTVRLFRKYEIRIPW